MHVRYGKPVFFSGQKFCWRILDTDLGRALTCYHHQHAKDEVAGGSVVVHVALKLIPRGWRLVNNGSREIQRVGGWCSLPLTRRLK